MPQVNVKDCEALASRLLDVTGLHDAHIGAGALIRALRAYGDARPDLRFALGRALLLMGGEFVSTSAVTDIASTANRPPATPSIH